MAKNTGETRRKLRKAAGHNVGLHGLDRIEERRPRSPELKSSDSRAAKRRAAAKSKRSKKK